MASTKPNEWIQIVGIFAVVASLIFVGMQLKQSQEIAASQAFQSRANVTIEMILATAENPLFTAATAKTSRRNGEALTDEEQVVMQQYAIALLYMYENQHYQYVSGFSTEERWDAAERTLTGFMSGGSNIPVRNVFETRRNQWSSNFSAVVTRLIEKIDEDAASD